MPFVKISFSPFRSRRVAVDLSAIAGRSRTGVWMSSGPMGLMGGWPKDRKHIRVGLINGEFLIMGNPTVDRWRQQTPEEDTSHGSEQILSEMPRPQRVDVEEEDSTLTQSEWACSIQTWRSVIAHNAFTEGAEQLFLRGDRLLLLLNGRICPSKCFLRRVKGVLFSPLSREVP